MSFKPAISSMSLGRAWVHKLLPKLDAAVANGLKGIEVFYEDLEHLAREQNSLDKTSTTPLSDQMLLKAARTIKKWCDERDIVVIGLQPFSLYEGLLDRTEHAKHIEKMKVWLQLAKALGSDIIQIPANFLPAEQITGDLNIVVKDLQEVADMGAKESPVIRFAYENLCWSTYFDTWEKVWDVVERVNRPNFGICLDTFNIAGRVYADPASSSGCTPNGPADLAASLRNMAKSIDVKKVFFIQVVDAEKMRMPLVEGHAFYDKDQPTRMSWSRNARLFYGEKSEGGYLPVEDVLKTIIVELEYKGWVSMELFSRTMDDPDEKVPMQHAKRAAVSWEKVQKDIKRWTQEPSCCIIL